MKIDITGLSDEQRQQIEAVLNPKMLDITDLPKDLVYQVNKVLNTNMPLKQDEAVRVVREYLRSKKNAKNR